MAESSAKQRAESFSSAEQSLLMQVYEEHRDVISRKGNTTAINKAREGAWQSIADRLNASKLSGQRRSWQQVKIKYKNILSNASKKHTEQRATGVRPPPHQATPAETLDLRLHQAAKQRSSTNPVDFKIRAPFVEVRGDQIIVLEPPQPPEEEAAEDTAALYKRYLQLSVEHKRLQIKKLQLEIKQMEKDPDSL